MRSLINFHFSDEHLSQVSDGKPSSEIIAIDRQTLSRLDVAISALPRKLKEPLILTALEGLSHRDAGEILGVSAKAVEVRVYRARQKLAKILEAPMC